MDERHSTRSLAAHLYRALRLRCPACGKKPMFVPWHKVRSLRDWFSPLDGCPLCGYPYERELGYYLMAIWAVNYGFGSILGIAIYVVLEVTFDLSLKDLLLAVITPVIFFNILFARHAKALFLAVDLYFDPHDRGGGDDGGNKPVEPPQPTSPSVRPCREPVTLR